ncbi:uncharacterized protein BJ171DRAFT_532585 [Polychytrium aggregatum]|uniref:uncharacterized protein n=1 Tax=Polychytrium aggregatum TaxID=110093 RepID=UPI0022FE7DF5|nr:uncharacterized protein BJ171DRAFT_532585 [Polychytrium aggregatum]KAI9193167.1 hypothetical protein BJ171DRAFT_532585 [Polychytrium aggregatum]
MIRQALNSRIPPPTLAAPRRKKDASWYIEPVVSGWDQELEWCFAGLAATRQEWQGYVPCPGASWDWSQDTDLASPAPNHDTGVEGQGPRLRHQAPALPHTAAVETRDHGGPLTSIEYVESEIRTTISEASLAETALENEMDAVAEELADPAGSALTDGATAAEAAIQADAVIGPLDMASTEKIVVLPSARLPLSPNSPSSPGALPNTANDASFIASPPRA